MIEVIVNDWKGQRIVVGSRVTADDDGPIATVTEITDPDGDVDDEGRSYGIPPYVRVYFDGGGKGSFRSTSTAQFYDEDPSYECDELEVVQGPG
jgi:hypothetical protein